MKQIVIIADDLTGACDTGVKFRQAGLRTKVLVKADSASRLNTKNVPVISVNTESRSVSGEEAGEIVRKLIRQLQSRGDCFYYKKIDSVLRGNILAELEVVFQLLNPDFALVAPAFPATGRWLQNGILSIGDKEQPHLQINAMERLCTQTERSCGHIDLQTVRMGVDAVVGKAHELHNSGCTVLLADTWCEQDLDVLAEAVLRLGERCLPVGSAGLAAHLAQHMADTDCRTCLDSALPKPEAGALLTVVGSRHPVTVEQVQLLKNTIPMEAYLLPVEGINDNNLLERTKEMLENRISGDTGSILLTTNQIYYNSDNCQHLFQQNAFNRSILDGIGWGVKTLAHGRTIRGIIATGGDVGSEVMSRLGLEQIDLMTEPLPGVVTGYAADRNGKGVYLATKSGGFGDPSALLELCRYMHDL